MAVDLVWDTAAFYIYIVIPCIYSPIIHFSKLEIRLCDYI